MVLPPSNHADLQHKVEQPVDEIRIAVKQTAKWRSGARRKVGYQKAEGKSDRRKFIARCRVTTGWGGDPAELDDSVPVLLPSTLERKRINLCSLWPILPSLRRRSPAAELSIRCPKFPVSKD